MADQKKEGEENNEEEDDKKKFKNLTETHIEDIEEMHKKTIDPVTGRLFMKYSL